jgi:hypothetical protein
MTFRERIEIRNKNKEEYFKRFGHHYTTYGYFMLDTQKDDDILQQCIDENKPLTQVLDPDICNIIRNAAHGQYTHKDINEI